MKKFKIILLLMLVLFPTFVNAEENKFNIIASEEAKLEEDINGSSVTAGNNVISTNVVKGINMLFGNNVEYQSDSEYVVLAGNIVKMSGNIQNDGFIFGNIINFEESFTSSRDLIVFGSTVELQGKIDRDVTIYASSVRLDNLEILGNITIYSTTLEINDETKINGVLSYNEDNEISISNNAQITETKLLDKLAQESTFKDIIYNFFVDYAGIMVIFLVLAFIVPNLFRKIENIAEEFTLSKTFSLLGFGAMLLIGVPLLIIVLFTTLIGTSLAILALLIYIIIVWLSIIFTGYLLGNIIWKKFIKKENNILLIGLIGISIISILQMIPVIGEYIAIFSLFIGLGIVLQLFKKNK